jgi:hypothetical protein
LLCDQWFRGPKGQRVPIDDSLQLWLPVTFDPTTDTATSAWTSWPTTS